MTDDLAAFYAARLDEDEATAQQAGEARIAWLTYRDSEGQMFYTTVAAAGDYSPWVAGGKDLPEPDSVLIVYDPARVLRDVEAGRKILALYTETRAVIDAAAHETGMVAARDYLDAGRELAVLEDVVRIKAAVHSDHPDYQESWRPISAI